MSGLKLPKSSLLVSLFIATGALLGGKAHAQTPSLSSGASATAQQTAKARTGLLFIRGPEQTGSPFLAKASLEAKSFRAQFKNNPVQTVGDGYAAIDIQDILKSLDALADSDIDDIVIVNFMHGTDETKTRADGTFMADNGLMYSADGKTFSADSLYKAIGDRFKTNPKLQDKKLLLMHQSCHGETALNAFHHLPAGTDIFYYSGKELSTWYEPGRNAFSNAYGRLAVMAMLDKKSEPAMNRNTAYAAGFFSSNAHGITDKNDMRFVHIQENADTLTWQGKKFHFGTHGGQIAKPNDIMKNVLNAAGDDDIVRDLRDYGDIVPEKNIRTALSSYKEAVAAGTLNTLDSKTYDCLSFITVTMALKHPHFLENTLSYGQSVQAFGIGGKPDVPKR